MAAMRMAAMVVLASACSAPESAFVGDWEGQYECNGAWADGEPYREGPFAQTVRINTDLNGELYQAGDACTLPLEIVSETRADYLPSSCTAVLSTGDVVEFFMLGGRIEIGPNAAREEVLDYHTSIQVDFVDFDDFFTANCSFEGVRAD